jgi:hypothetical protein
VVIADRLQLPIIAAMVAGAALCFELRFVAIRFGWGLVIARPPRHPTAVTDSVAEPRDTRAQGS